MNILATIGVHAGGQGSGPSAPCPQCGPHKEHQLEEKDVVTLKTPQTLWNMKTGNVDKFGPGLKATVVNVLPKTGDNPQMIKVMIHPPTKRHEQDYMVYVKKEDTELHHPGSKEQVENIKPVRKGMTIAKFKTWDGADVTWVRAKEEKETAPKTLTEMSKTPHGMKGHFELIDSIAGKQDRPGYKRTTKMYDTSGMPAHFQQGRGAVVWVHTYSKKGAIKEVKIQEQDYTTYGQKTRGMLSFSYKNAAQAVGMLKERYGIKTKLSRLA